MNKIINGFLFGFLLVLPIDFIVFIALKKHYFDFYKMNLFFNIYFFDNQPFVPLLIISLIFGFLILYTPLKKFLQIFYIVILLNSSFLLFKPFGNYLGEKLFRKNDLTFKLGSQMFKADLLYEGRSNYFIKRSHISHTIKLSKQNAFIE